MDAVVGEVRVSGSKNGWYRDVRDCRICGNVCRYVQLSTSSLSAVRDLKLHAPPSRYAPRDFEVGAWLTRTNQLKKSNSTGYNYLNEATNDLVEGNAALSVILHNSSVNERV